MSDSTSQRDGDSPPSAAGPDVGTTEVSDQELGEAPGGVLGGGPSRATCGRVRDTFSSPFPGHSNVVCSVWLAQAQRADLRLSDPEGTA